MCVLPWQYVMQKTFSLLVLYCETRCSASRSQILEIENVKIVSIHFLQNRGHAKEIFFFFLVEKVISSFEKFLKMSLVI